MQSGGGPQQGGGGGHGRSTAASASASPTSSSSSAFDQQHQQQQRQAMQAIALERNIDLSNPANANVIAQLIPLVQSRMMSQHKANESSTAVQSASFAKQHVTSPQVGNESSPRGNSSSDVSGQSGSFKARQTVSPAAPMDVDSRDGFLQRRQSIYKSLDEGFEIQKEMYRGQQYSQIYFARLHLMRTLLYSLVPTWKPYLPICTVLGLEEGKECIIVGTLYKHMKLKPSVLDEYSKERSVTPLVKPHNFTHSDDYLVLEDESGRVKLRGTLLLPSVYVTGIVVALHGKETGAGDFMVENILEAGLPPQIDLPLNSGEDKYVVFVSGLSVGSSSSNPLHFQLLIDHITGHLGDEKEQGIAAQIVQVVVVGNSIENPRGLFNGQNLGTKDQSKLSEPIKELDILLSQIAAGIPLDIMPGTSDPANFALPQQPLHRCLFPGSSAYNTFRSCTNPHSFELDNVKFLGTSGQNIDDLQKYSDAKDKLEFVERTLKWRHIAPTAPNTLGCYPFTDRDPFFLESCPHVYFVGNQDKYETHFIKGSEGQVVRLICIPRFSETGISVVLNLRNLECHSLSFGTEFSS